MSKTSVHHEYTFSTTGLSAYGKVKSIMSALEPLKSKSDYGYVETPGSVTIWWKTYEDLG